LEAANIKPGSVDYVEAHGTGTALGDPIEVGALNEAYGDRSRPLFIGSAKGNFGHLEAASGLLSLLKVTLSLHAGVIPSSLHGTPLNSEISWPDLPIQLATDRRTWCAAQGRRRAGISSFGMSGTNCHLLIEEGPSTERDDIVAPGPHLIVLSADSRDALAQLAAAYWDFLAETPLPLDALSCALGRGRSHLSIRAAFVAHDPDELMSALASLAWSRSQSHIHLSEDRLPKRPEIPTVELSINAADCERTRNTISALRKRLAELRIVTPTQHYSDVSDQTASRLDESSPIIRVAGQAIPVPHQLVSDVACEYNTLARLYIAGADLNWSACISGGVHKPRLPTYPFSLSPFWFDLPQNKLA